MSDAQPRRRRRSAPPPSPVAAKFTARTPVPGLLGIVSVRRDAFGRRVGLVWHGRRLALVVLALAAVGYAFAVTSIYAWYKWNRNLPGVALADVATLRLDQVREQIGAAQYTLAREAWRHGGYRDAFFHGIAAVRHAPRHEPARLLLAECYAGAGLVERGLATLEQGLVLEPGSAKLQDRLLALLLQADRPAEVRQRVAAWLAPQPGADAARASALAHFALQAALREADPAAALACLAEHPTLPQLDAARPDVARALWRGGRRTEAVQLLAAHTPAHPEEFAPLAQLADYLRQLDRTSEAQQLAALACQHHPDEPGAWLLAVATRSPDLLHEARAWNGAVVDYLRRWGANPAARHVLADLAGARGWVDLAAALYADALVAGTPPERFALAYADALATRRRPQEAWSALQAIERQLPPAAPALPALRLRQLILAERLGRTTDLGTLAQALLHDVRRDARAIRRVQEQLQQAAAPQSAAAFEAARLRPERKEPAPPQEPAAGPPPPAGG